MSRADNAPTPRAPYLRIGTAKQFGAFAALKDISLEIFPGEFVCFLGPSGCGKTTLLRAIAGLDIQTSGRIFQADKEISNLPASHRDFGIVFQSYALFPNLTVAANVGYGLVSRKLPKVEIATRVKRSAAARRFARSGANIPAQLSGGQQQRVALARALALSPGLLLLDEPLSALDARVRAHLRTEIRQLHTALGVTTIMVTHDQEEALTMADRIVVMNQGVIEQVGTPTEVYRQAGDRVRRRFRRHHDLPGVVVAARRRALHRHRPAVRPRHPAGTGSDVTLAIRPEDVVCAIVATNPNTFMARVAESNSWGRSAVRSCDQRRRPASRRGLLDQRRARPVDEGHGDARRSAGGAPACFRAQSRERRSPRRNALRVTTAASRAAPRPPRRRRLDRRVMRAGICLIGWLLITLALPLWTLLSKSFEDPGRQVRRARQLRPLLLHARAVPVRLEQPARLRRFHGYRAAAGVRLRLRAAAELHALEGLLPGIGADPDPRAVAAAGDLVHLPVRQPGFPQGPAVGRPDLWSRRHRVSQVFYCFPPR